MMATRHGLETLVKGMAGVRRVLVVDSPDAHGFFWVLVDGGSYDEIRAELEANRAAGITFGLTVSRAPWWWRLGCWVRALMSGGAEA